MSKRRRKEEASVFYIPSRPRPLISFFINRALLHSTTFAFLCNPLCFPAPTDFCDGSPEEGRRWRLCTEEGDQEVEQPDEARRQEEAQAQEVRLLLRLHLPRPQAGLRLKYKFRPWRGSSFFFNLGAHF